MDFLSVLFVAIVWAVVAASGNKKKGKGAAAAKGRTKPSAPRREPARKKGVNARGTLFDRMDSEKDSVSAGRNVPGAAEGEDPCHEEMLGQARPAAVRYEAASQETFDRAAEGEDPCHPVAESAPHAGDAPRKAEVDDGFRDAVLSGIVMSEVLKRPAQRRQERAAQRQRRAEHGRMNAAARAAGRQ